MRLATVVLTHGGAAAARARHRGYVDVAQRDRRRAAVGLSTAVLGGGVEALELVRRRPSRTGREIDEAEFGPAVPSPRRILCLGVNYVEHALEGGRPPTTWPETFVRGADSVAAPVRRLVKPDAERAIRLRGRARPRDRARRALYPPPDAFAAIAGYAVSTDGTAREWQRAASQWTPGKNFDGTMPIGPSWSPPMRSTSPTSQLTTRSTARSCSRHGPRR